MDKALTLVMRVNQQRGCACVRDGWMVSFVSATVRRYTISTVTCNMYTLHSVHISVKNM